MGDLPEPASTDALPPIGPYRQMLLFRVTAASSLGPVMEGISGAIRLLGEDKRQYVCKKPELEHPSPYGVVAEFVCCNLAHSIGLKVPESGVIDFDGRPWFASLDLGHKLWLPGIPESVIVNLKDIAGPITVFDIFVRNRDRHQQQLILQMQPDEEGSRRYLVWAIDFAHALFTNDDDPLGSLEGYSDPNWFVKKSPLVKHVTGRDQLEPTIAALEALPLHIIEQAVGMVPPEWWPEGNRSSAMTKTVRFLRKRQTQLRRDVMAVFPTLYEGGTQ